MANKKLTRKSFDKNALELLLLQEQRVKINGRIKELKHILEIQCELDVQVINAGEQSNNIMEQIMDICELEERISDLTREMKNVKKSLGINYKKNLSEGGYYLEKAIRDLSKKDELYQWQEQHILCACLRIYPQMAISQIFGKNKNKERQEAAINCLLDNLDELAKLFKDGKIISKSGLIKIFSGEELEFIYNVCGNELFNLIKRGFWGVLEYCLAFENLISQEHKEILVQKLINKKDTRSINLILNSNITLNNELKERLHSVLVIQQLQLN